MGLKKTRETHESILQEIQQERVAALTRISTTLESLINQMNAVREAVEASSGAARAEQVEAHRALREKALKYRWYLEVQREAMGLRGGQHRLDEFYRVPDEI